MIGFASQRYTRSLVMRLKAEERSKMELWAMATRKLITATGNDEAELELTATIIENNTTVPLILTDGEGRIISSANFGDQEASKDNEYIAKELKKIREKTEPIIIDLGDGHFNYIWYKDSIILRKVRYYPWVQLIVIIFFGGVSYMAFSSSRRAEENQVWVGMSRETAHQLGTPVSSLSAWLEMLREKYPDETLSDEIQKDIRRLEKITQRFSGIGARPEMQVLDLPALTETTINYLKNRTSSKVKYTIKNETDRSGNAVAVNSELFEWVVENICRNAIDAMEGRGEITITFSRQQSNMNIDFCDTGKGIPRRAFSTIFRPGYTTKKTGWGLGLSLAKRIIEDYHKGRIFVYSSEPGKGTCIRVILQTP
ncbi:MAG: HAMP domain-containing histidine kinase [Bacteroidales bacterium]|nr:HAMP domain-containing histidine kinase [Bacteroidales bacterium]